MPRRYATPDAVPPNFGLGGAVARLLVVMPGFAGDRDSRTVGEGSALYGTLGALWRLVTTRSYRQFVRNYRDFYANPRAPDYMVARLVELVRAAAPGAAVRLVAVAPEAPPIPSDTLPGGVEVVLVPGRADLPARVAECLGSGAVDAAVLLHHDALGLGLSPVERVLLDRLPERTFVLNGRRRVYALDAEMQRGLALRRFLAETRIVELALGFLVRPYAAWNVPAGRATKP